MHSITPVLPLNSAVLSRPFNRTCIPGANIGDSAVPIIVDLGHNFSSYDLKTPSHQSSWEIEDLTRGLVLDSILHHTDRHSSNYFEVKDCDGKWHYYPIDNGLIDLARGDDGQNVMDSVKDRLSGDMQSDRASFGRVLREKIGRRDGTIESRERFLRTVRDIKERLRGMNAEEMVQEIVAILPDGGERVNNQGDHEHGLHWLAERIQIFLTMTDKEIIEAIFSFDHGQAPDYDVLLQETGLA